MIDEGVIQEGIRATMADMDAFSDYPESVVINDWSIFDIPIIEGPFALIENSDNVRAIQDTVTSEVRWEIPVVLLVAFDDWKVSRNAIRDLRSAVLRAFVNAKRSPGTTDDSPVDVKVIRTDGPIYEVNMAYEGQENTADILPTYLAQRLIFEADQEYPETES